MAIGCNVPENMSQNLLEGYHLHLSPFRLMDKISDFQPRNVPAIMTFISEIVKIGLLSSVSLSYCRDLVQLKDEGETGTA